MSEKLTPWFDGDVKPTHQGVYLRRIAGLSDVGNYAYWNGEFWGAFVGVQDGPARALKFRDTPSAYHDRPWRGLAQKPENAK